MNAAFSGVRGSASSATLADVDPRFDRERHAGLERTAGLADVVHVDPDVVRRAVRVPDAVLFAAGVGDQAQLQQAGLDHLDGAAVHVLQRRARLGGLQSLPAARCSTMS